MKKVGAFLRRHYYKPLIAIGFFLFWELAVRIFGIKEFVIPSPFLVFAQFYAPEFADKYAWLEHIQTTLAEILVSFCLTCLAGVGVAILMSWSKLFRGLFTPLITVFNSLPKIVLAPLFIIWFGWGFAANVGIAILVAFFPVVLNTSAGLNAVDEDLLDLVRYLHASKWQVFTKIRIPNSLPFIFSGLKISATLSVVGAIVGEFIASSQGLGFLIKDAQAALDTAPMFGSLLIISGIGLSLFGLIGVLEKLLMPWHFVGEDAA
jgi:NitT/TauT family transport system permease protein